MDIPLLQTEQWQNFQKDLGEKTFFEKTPDFQYLAIKKSTPFGSYLYLPYGPVAENPKSFKLALKSLISLAKENSAIFIRIEPRDPKMAQFLQNKTIKTISGIKKIKKSTDLNPKETWVLDLTQDEKEIIKNFAQSTRTRFNQFKNKGLSVEISKNPSDIKYLVNLQKKLAKVKKFNTFSEKYLKTELEQDFATLYLVKYQSKVIVASLFFDDQTTRYYMQSAADLDYKKLPGTVALLTTAIFDAKAKNLQKFDFWGVAPENAPKNHPWYGFTTFKKSFGGRISEYAGDYDLILNPAKYSFYQISRRLNRLFRKFF